MNLEPMDSPLPNIKMWGATDGERHFCVTYDESYPPSGYRASWHHVGKKTTYLQDRYKSLSHATKALVHVQKYLKTP